jgi:hypothetical protein
VSAFESGRVPQAETRRAIDTPSQDEPVQRADVALGVGERVIEATAIDRSKALRVLVTRRAPAPERA